MWIGHFIVDPRQRGRAWGARFAQALLSHAFIAEAAAKVLLVVFPENRRAIRCYQRAGMLVTGSERKYFESTGRAHQFLRMEIRPARFRRLVSDGVYSGRPTPLLPLPSSVDRPAHFPRAATQTGESVKGRRP
jgi:hypothetical protein